VAAAYLAYGEYQAIGVSPFGVDSRTDAELAALTDAYRAIGSVATLLTDAAGKRPPTRGFRLGDGQESATLAFGDVRIVVTHASAFGVVDDTGSFGYGLVIGLAEDVFVFAGRGFHATFESADPAEQVLIEGVSELPHDGAAADGRRLNGDETGGGTRVIHPPIDRVVSPFPIAVGHAHSGISQVTVYRMPRTSP
jgi:Domain of unknown function (DUF5597)